MFRSEENKTISSKKKFRNDTNTQRVKTTLLNDGSL